MTQIFNIQNGQQVITKNLKTAAEIQNSETGDDKPTQGEIKVTPPEVPIALKELIRTQLSMLESDTCELRHNPDDESYQTECGFVYPKDTELANYKYCPECGNEIWDSGIVVKSGCFECDCSLEEFRTGIFVSYEDEIYHICEECAAEKIYDPKSDDGE